jgi:hypothetical protein
MRHERDKRVRAAARIEQRNYVCTEGVRAWNIAEEASLSTYASVVSAARSWAEDREITDVEREVCRVVAAEPIRAPAQAVLTPMCRHRHNAKTEVRLAQHSLRASSTHRPSRLRGTTIPRHEIAEVECGTINPA